MDASASRDYLVVAEVYQNDSARRVVGPFVASIRAQQGEADAVGKWAASFEVSSEEEDVAAGSLRVQVAQLTPEVFFGV